MPIAQPRWENFTKVFNDPNQAREYISFFSSLVDGSDSAEGAQEDIEDINLSLEGVISDISDIETDITDIESDISILETDVEDIQDENAAGINIHSLIDECRSEINDLHSLLWLSTVPPHDHNGDVLCASSFSKYIGVLKGTPTSPIDINGQEATYGDSARMTGNLAIGGYDLAGYAAQRGALKAKLLDGSGVHKGYISFAIPGGAGAGINFLDTTGVDVSQIFHHNANNQLRLTSTGSWVYLDFVQNDISGNLYLGDYDGTRYATQTGALKSRLTNGAATPVHMGYIEFASPGSNGPALNLLDTSFTNNSFLQHNNAGNYLELNSDRIYANTTKFSVGATPLTNECDVGCLNSGVLALKETTTPTADANYGKIYTKNDNNAYFQDGAGTEQLLGGASGWSGTFTNGDGATVTVTDGVITNVA